MEWHRAYTAAINEHRNLIFMQKLLNCIRSEGILRARFTGSTKFKHLSWTYHVFIDLKVFVVSNGCDIRRAFLSEPTK